ncbi:2OG-Fe dioxygenase family protein [Caulobacter sp. KR2-114]|uniref:2OG-Fe dioxygenase family protein n=1 Tax=Caulobacter sp. KR2-114 TaxID=3400912 RepID=UPI003C0AF066
MRLEILNRPAANGVGGVLKTAEFSGQAVNIVGGAAVFSPKRAINITAERPLGVVKGDLAGLSAAMRAAFFDFSQLYYELPADPYLQDGASFRRRCFSTYTVTADVEELSVSLDPPRSYFQSAEINRYAGGISREFAPIPERYANNEFLVAAIRNSFQLLPVEMRSSHSAWEAGVHPTRIVSDETQVGYAAPEGIHQDGHSFATIILIARNNVVGGSSIFADLDKRIFWDRPLLDPLDTVIWEDKYCFHDVSAVDMEDKSCGAYRDVLGISWNPSRRG